MNLGKQFNKTINRKSEAVTAYILAGIASLGIIYVLNLLWNYISPVWGLPILTYLEFLSTLFLLTMFVQFFGLKATNSRANPNIDIVNILGESPYEKQ